MSFIRNNRRLVLACLLIFGLAGFALQGLAGPGETGALDWLSTTPGASARNSVDECGQNSLCLELCFTTVDGHSMPQGQFRCEPVL